MYGSKHKTNVALFPLCDTRGVLRDALSDTTDEPTTRGDAIVFAWRLELPKSIKVADAANAQLTVAMNVPRKAWSRQQLLIIRELMVLAGREGHIPDHTHRADLTERRQPGSRTAAPKNKPKLKAAAKTSKASTDANLKPIDDAQESKESKQWWKLVGKHDEGDIRDHLNRRRKSRYERVSREP